MGSDQACTVRIWARKGIPGRTGEGAAPIPLGEPLLKSLLLDPLYALRRLVLPRVDDRRNAISLSSPARSGATSASSSPTSVSVINAQRSEGKVDMQDAEAKAAVHERGRSRFAHLANRRGDVLWGLRNAFFRHDANAGVAACAGEAREVADRCLISSREDRLRSAEIALAPDFGSEGWGFESLRGAKFSSFSGSGQSFWVYHGSGRRRDCLLASHQWQMYRDFVSCGC
jgi:hypothetical protein